jgi:hypothetical protein
MNKLLLCIPLHSSLSPEQRTVVDFGYDNYLPAEREIWANALATRLSGRGAGIGHWRALYWEDGGEAATGAFANPRPLWQTAGEVVSKLSRNFENIQTRKGCEPLWSQNLSRPTTLATSGASKVAAYSCRVGV